MNASPVTTVPSSSSGKILVTGATGGLGRAIVEALLKKIPASRIVATARRVDLAAPLAARGVEVRRADYLDPRSLPSAFAGVTKLFLVSAPSFTDRTTQHINVIDAARAAGVRHIFYPTIQRKDDTTSPIDGVTRSDIETENYLKASGLAYTIIRHPLYTEALVPFLGPRVLEQGIVAPAGDGRMPYTGRDDLAEGAAALLTQPGHENREYLLNAGYSYTLTEVAALLSRELNRSITYSPVDVDTYLARRVEEGTPAPVAAFFAGWFTAIRQGAFAESSDLLPQLLNRQPAPVGKHLSQLLTQT